MSKLPTIRYAATETATAHEWKGQLSAPTIRTLHAPKPAGNKPAVAGMIVATVAAIIVGFAGAFALLKAEPTFRAMVVNQAGEATILDYGFADSRDCVLALFSGSHPIPADWRELFCEAE